MSFRWFLPEIVIIAIVVAFSVGLHYFVQRRFRPAELRRHNDVAGYLFSAVGVIYAVLLGFVVVVVWQKYDVTVANVDTEIAAVSDLYRSVGAFSEPARSAIRADLRAYADAMVNVEWPHMSQHIVILKDIDLLEDIGHRVDTYPPRNPGQADAHLLAMEQLERLFDARRERIAQTAPSIPMILWFALVAGALAMLAFAYLFGVENRPAQLAMTAILAGLIAILFTVIAEFDDPFSGSVSISNSSWLIVQEHLKQIP